MKRKASPWPLNSTRYFDDYLTLEKSVGVTQYPPYSRYNIQLTWLVHWYRQGEYYCRVFDTHAEAIDYASKVVKYDGFPI